MSTLSLIIPVYNAAATLEACLTSVSSSTVPAQVIVVDDGSTDATCSIAARFPCQVLHTGSKTGAAAARNRGARAACGDILFFLDGDMLMERDTAARILELFRADPALDALFGSYQKETVPKNFVSVYKNLLHHYTHQNSAAAAATFCSGFGAIRRDVFLALNGFDESQQALEDIEFGYRLYRSGHQIRLIKDLQFTHLKTYSLAGLVRSDMLNRAIPWTRLMLKQHIFRNDLNTKSNNVASVVLSFLLLLAPLWVWFMPLSGWLVAVLLLLFVLANFGFLSFVTRERGLVFGVKCIAMSWFFYLYSGLGLLLGVGMFVSERVRARA